MAQGRGQPPHPQDSEPRSELGTSQPTVGTYFLGRYRVVDEIGIGGMASVHLARMDGPGGFQKWVAIKRIHSHLVEDESFIQMFLDEARVAARISHPNVATVFELGKHEDTYWIAMEYLHGEPLRELMRRTEELGSTMPPEIACRVIADAAEGLHAAHELLGKNGEKLNLVHRDVTPHNLFVTYDGNTKVVDFGIAKFSSRMASTRAGTLKGKLAYMSPEQVAGEALDRRTDIFALGVVLWELTTGQRLFRMESDLDTLAKVQECNVPRPSTIIRGYPLDLEKIVVKALSKNRGERFKTAREFSRALQSLLMKRGLFIAADEVATYTRSIFEDRIQKREAHLRWAAEVTQTISLDAIQSSPAAGEVSQQSFKSDLQSAAPTQRLAPTPAAVAPRGAPRPAAGAPALNQTLNIKEQVRRPPSDLARTVPRPPLHSAATVVPGAPAAHEEDETDDGPTIMSAAPEIEESEEEDATVVNADAYDPQRAAPAPTPAAGRPAAEGHASVSVRTAIAVPPRPLPPRAISQAPALPAVVVDAPPQQQMQQHQQPWAPPPMPDLQQQRPAPPASAAASGGYPQAAPGMQAPMQYPGPVHALPPRDQRTVAVKAYRKGGVPMWAVTVLSGIAALALLAVVYFVAVPTQNKGPTQPALPTTQPGMGPFGAARARFTDLVTPAAPTSSAAPSTSASTSPSALASASAAPAPVDSNSVAAAVSPPPVTTAPATARATATATGTGPTALGAPVPTVRATAHPAPLPLPSSPYEKTPTGQLTVICMPACDGVYEGSTSFGAPPIYKKTLPVGTHRIRLATSNPSVTKTISVMIAADQVDIERVLMTP